jgi:hypothetical protein
MKEMESANKIIDLLLAEQKKYSETSAQYAIIDAAGLVMDALNVFNYKNGTNSEEVIACLAEATESIFTVVKIILASKTAEAKMTHPSTKMN